MMKKILCVILCICMLFTTEMITFVASAIEALPDVDLAALENALESLGLIDEYYGDIVVVYCYDPQNASAGVDSNLPDPMNIVLDRSSSSFQEEFVIRSLVGYEASCVTSTELLAEDTQEQRNAKMLSLDKDGVGIDTQEEHILFDLKDIDSTQQRIYYVYYTAIDVNYTVRYYFQNTTGDEYTEISTLVQAGQAKTGSVFSDLELAEMISGNVNLPENFEKGYKLLHAIPDMVAADGSTVFQVYFDREYFSINFSLDDGFGVDQVYDRYGANATIGIPTKPGYTFNGWYELTVDTNDDGIPDTKANNAPLLQSAALPKTIGVENKYYEAVWEEIVGATSYVVAYWAKESNNTQYLLGSKTVTGVSAGIVVNGSDDLKIDFTCGFLEHTHGSACMKCGHTHTTSCATSPFTYVGYSLGNSNDENVINALENGYPESGFVYAIQTGTDQAYDRYWLKLYLGNAWYQIGTAVYGSNMSTYVSGEAVGNAEKGGYYVTKYYVNGSALRCGHTHDASCNDCDIAEHMHSTSCKLAATHLIYDGSITDKNVTVKGDGTTVVNVYYHHKEYTLRFFYARSDKSETTFEVVGGTTYGFGDYADKNQIDTEDAWGAVATLLTNPSDWGKVNALPALKTSYIDNASLISTYHLKTGVLETNDYKYYYFEFQAPFASDISDIWPVDIFESVEIAEMHSDVNHGGTENGTDINGNGKIDYCQWEKAYFSAWNGQKGVKYSTDNDNQTIKGAYQYLDENLIFDDTIPGYHDDDIVSYLCFWVNGDNVNWSIPREFAYDIFLQVSASQQQMLNDQASGATTVVQDGKEYQKKDGKWYLLYKEFSVFDNSSKDQVSNQTKISLEGYECVEVVVDPTTDKNEDGLDVYHYYFYYDLVTKQVIILKNEGVEVHSLTNEPYGSLLKDCVHGFDLNLSNQLSQYYPVTLEPNAYVFKGWCTTYPCTDDTIIDLNAYTIPEEDVILHAYWVKNTYSVKFFDALGGNLLYQFGNEDHADAKITHGTAIASKLDNNGNPLSNPTRENDHFLGWFYMDGMTRKRFDPQHTLVKGDLEVFAMWEGTTPRDYTIQYVYINNGVEVEIATPTTGVARENSTKTFVAKAGSELNEGYQTNFFPISQSHSIIIGESGNEYSFEYFHVDSELEYVVRYVDSATGLLLPINGTLSDGTNIVNGEARITTKSSYVVQPYYPYTDTSDPNNYKYYIPDSYKKSLVLSVKENSEGDYISDTDKNVIEFEYTLQEQPTGYFVVNFYAEKLENTSAALTTNNCDLISSIEGSVPYVYRNGQYVPNTQNVDLIQPVGFTYGTCFSADTSIQKRGNVISFEVDADGVEVNVFYKRNEYEYNVNIDYLQNDIEKTYSLVSKGKAKYGEKIIYELSEAEKKLIPGYRPINFSAFVTITEIAKNNEIVFYYEPIQYNISYIPVTFMGGIKQTSGTMGGYTSPNAENKFYTSGEQTFSGSTAQANPYFEFVGWYKDEDCTEAVSVNAKYVPLVNDLSETEVNKFYAKFERKTGALTIHRDYTGVDASQVFVYKITNNVDSITLYVTASVANPTIRIEGLLQGNYSIEQVTDWSWRYTEDTVKTIAITNDEFEITFANTASNASWLNYNSPFYRNIFGGAVN